MPPERTAIARIVENKTTLIDSGRDRFIIEDMSLSKESTTNAPIRTETLTEEIVKVRFDP